MVLNRSVGGSHSHVFIPHVYIPEVVGLVVPVSKHGLLYCGGSLTQSACCTDCVATVVFCVGKSAAEQRYNVYIYTWFESLKTRREKVWWCVVCD